MLRTKTDIDRHVHSLLAKFKNEQERNVRSLPIAQLYYKVQDYTSVLKYVSMYLSVNSESAAAQKLLGQAYEGLGEKVNAIAAYKKSLEISDNQPEVIKKICQLICDKDVPFVPSKVRYWLEKSSALFPHSPVTFALKEKLLATSSPDGGDGDLVKLIESELNSKPNDVNLQIKLINTYLGSGKVEQARNYALDIETKQIFHHEITWYQCVGDVCDAYSKQFSNKCDWEFYIQWVYALNRICSLSLSDPLQSVVEPSKAVYMFDRVLNQSRQLINVSPDIYSEFSKYMSAQLAYYIAVVLLKGAVKQEQLLWKDTKKLVIPLFLLATSSAPSHDRIWGVNVKEFHRKLLTACAHEAQCRLTQSGHFLNALLSKECKSDKQLLERLNFWTSGNWRTDIFKKAFGSSTKKDDSCFLSNPAFANVPNRVPSLTTLQPDVCVPSFEYVYIQNLHYMVWLGLQYLSHCSSVLKIKLDPSFHTSSLRAIQFTANNLNNYGAETLCQLDVDSFLYAAVFSAGVIIEEQKQKGFFNEERPPVLPAELTVTLCTEEQSTWWKNAVQVGMGSGSIKINENTKISDIRHNLQRGIEVVRGESISLLLLVYLARTFALRANFHIQKHESSSGCEKRALHLWLLAVSKLERLRDHRPVRGHSMFDSPLKDKVISSEECNALLEEGRFYIACHYMKNKQFEEAIEAFKPLKTPQSLFNQALIYHQMAEDQFNSLRGEEITSEIRSKHTVLATRARDCLQAVKDMIRNDQSHPLHSGLKSKLVEVEELLGRIEPENGFRGGDSFNGTEPSLSCGSTGTPSGEGRHHVSTNRNYSKNKLILTSTPRNFDIRNLAGSAEIIELLSIHQNTSQLKTQQLMEQNKIILDRIESLSNSIDSLSNSVKMNQEEMASKFNKLESDVKNSISEMKKDLKKPEVYNVGDEEEFSEDLLQYQNLSYYPGRAANPNMPYAGQYFSPNQVYQGMPAAITSLSNMPFYTQPSQLPFENPQVSEYLRNQASTSSAMNAALNTKFSQAFQPNLAQIQSQLAASTLSGAHLTGLSAPSSIPGMPTSPLAKTTTFNQSQSLTTTTFPKQGPHNVVITNSDTLPTGTPPVQPTLSVTIPLEHRLGVKPPGESFAQTVQHPTSQQSQVPHNFQIAMPPMATGIPSEASQRVQAQVAADISNQNDDEESDCPEHDPMPDFQPIIPLPAEVEVRTGEEGQTELFAARAKLFRYVDKQWKEKGVGTLKILQDPSTGKCRVLMRRDTVLKMCANHFITSDMKLEPMPSSDRDWIWIANDFSFGEMQVENLAARFKTPKEAQKFKQVFDEVKVGNVPSPAPPAKEVSTPGSATPKGSVVLAPSKINVTETPKLTNPSKPLKFGGFAFSSSPVVTKSEEPKDKATEEKKPDNPFSSFSFSSFKPSFATPSLTPTKNPSLTPTKPASKDATKPSDSAASQKPLMFSSTGIDFAGLAKQAGDTPVFGRSSNGSFQGAGSTVFGDKSASMSTPTIHPSPGSPGSAQEPDEFVPTADFKPIIPLPALVDTQTGEENETVLYENRAKLLRFESSTKEWKERGIGKMKILKNPETGVIRLLMRREQVLKVCCNHRLTKDINIKPFSTSDKAMTWVAKDYSEEEGKDEVFAIKFKNAELALAFKEAVERAKSEAVSPSKQDSAPKETSDQPSLASLFKPKEGSWECSGCFVRNDASVVKCPACNTLKPGYTGPDPAVQKPTSTFSFGIPASTTAESKFTFGAAKPTFSVGGGGKFSFGVPDNTQDTTNKSQPPVFGNPTAEADSSTPSSGAPFSFGSSGSADAKDAPSSFSFSKPAQTAPSFGSSTFNFTMTASPLQDPKSPLKSEDGHSEHEDLDESGDNIYFQPVIPLPEKVKEVTGEEDEEVLYCHRAKLFRFDANSKEWKERGIGDIKILKHRQTNHVRLLMRREVVMKICLNHRLTKDIFMKPKDEKSWIWVAPDFSDGEVVHESFVIRFKTPDIAKEFKQAIDDAQAGQDDMATPPRPRLATQDHGEPEERVPFTEDDDVQVVYETPISEEDKQRARELMLPPTFFAYRTAPPCPGCLGCEPDDDDADKGSPFLGSSQPPSGSLFQGSPATPLSSGNIFGITSPGMSFSTPPSSPMSGSIFGGRPNAGQGANTSLFSSVTNTPIFGGAIDSTPKLFSASKQSSIFGQEDDACSEESSFSGLSCKFSNDDMQLSPSCSAPLLIHSSVLLPKSGAIQQSTEENKPQQGSAVPSFLNKGSEFSFASVAQSSGTAFNATPKGFKWEGAGQTVFGGNNSPATPGGGSDADANKPEGGAESGDEGAEDTSTTEHDPHFEPIIPLPDKIELKTGEEDEDIVLCERVKLYRFDTSTKEWKERGVGNFKLLKHREKNTYRFLMRRETVHKIVVNHLLTKDIQMDKLKTSNNSLMWVAMNLPIECDEPQLEKLAIKFKYSDHADSFKAKIDSIIQELKSSS